ncbi:hypothetical protein [Streptomyces sp. NPDC085529]|uniref:hypothetical protein n=1 Tax=Streptomyces sp. NPDC085529 TaxID=3365729 RepID=UPI0037CDFC0A
MSRWTGRLPLLAALVTWCVLAVKVSLAAASTTGLAYPFSPGGVTWIVLGALLVGFVRLPEIRAATRSSWATETRGLCRELVRPAGSLRGQPRAAVDAAVLARGLHERSGPEATVPSLARLRTDGTDFAACGYDRNRRYRAASARPDERRRGAGPDPDRGARPVRRPAGASGGAWGRRRAPRPAPGTWGVIRSSGSGR